MIFEEYPFFDNKIYNEKYVCKATKKKGFKHTIWSFHSYMLFCNKTKNHRDWQDSSLLFFFNDWRHIWQLWSFLTITSITKKEEINRKDVLKKIWMMTQLSNMKIFFSFYFWEFFFCMKKETFFEGFLFFLNDGNLKLSIFKLHWIQWCIVMIWHVSYIII